MKTGRKKLPDVGLLGLDVQWPHSPTYCCVAFAALDHRKRHILVCANFDSKQLSTEVVADLYQVRSQIELLFKEWKSMNSLNKFDTDQATIVKTLIWGACWRSP